MKKSILAVALFSLIIFFTSCSQPGEVTVSKYFQAMKLNDKDTMSSMAIEPKGLEFKSFEIVNIAEPVEKDLELPILEQKVKDTTKEKQDQGAAAMDASDDLEDLKDELEETRRASTRAQLRGKIEEAEKAFEEEKAKYNFILLKLTDLQKQVSREKDLIRMSTGRPEGLDMFTGKTFYQKVDVKVTLENGDVNDYVFLLRRTDLTLENKTINGRLIIVKILTAAEYEQEQQEKEAEEAAAAAADEKTEEVSEEKTAEEKNE